MGDADFTLANMSEIIARKVKWNFITHNRQKDDLEHLVSNRTLLLQALMTDNPIEQNVLVTTFLEKLKQAGLQTIYRDAILKEM